MCCQTQTFRTRLTEGNRRFLKKSSCVYTVRSESGLHAATALCTGTRNNGWCNIVRRLLMPRRLYVSDKDSGRFRLTFIYFVCIFFRSLSRFIFEINYTSLCAAACETCTSGKRTRLDILKNIVSLSNFEFFVLNRLKIPFDGRLELRSAPVSNWKTNFFSRGKGNFQKVLFCMENGSNKNRRIDLNYNRYVRRRDV